jgi:hypothetical protein
MLGAIGGPNLKTGVHLYAWYVDRFDTNNPRFVPHSIGTDTWGAAIAGLQSKVALVVPYINSSSLDIGSAPDTGTNKIQLNSGDKISDKTDRISRCPQVSGVGFWNLKLDSSHAYAAENYAIKTFDGQPLTFCADSGHLLASMDLSAPIWQDIVHDNVATVLDLGANGVYLDTFTGADSYRANYNPVTAPGCATACARSARTPYCRLKMRPRSAARAARDAWLPRNISPKPCCPTSTS